jgi:hypothetical protein
MTLEVDETAEDFAGMVRALLDPECREETEDADEVVLFGAGEGREW